MSGIYTEECPLCRAQMKYPVNYNGEQLCSCPNCGEYIYNSTYVLLLGHESYKDKKYKLIHFLLHHNVNGRVKFIGTKETYENFLKSKPNKPIQLVDFDTVENWYPKTFAEKIDYILLYLNSKTQYAGEKIEYSYKDLINIFFIFDKGIDFTKNVPQVYEDQINFIRDCLNKLGYVSVYSLGCANGLSWNHKITFQLTAEGFKRIYELQKTQSNNKNAFVAMKFGDETSELREKLKEGIREAGYEPIIMDEIEHNHQIVPEMLYQIKNSKFLIAEFSHHNNGAYYEAGYALGLGKEVIHICKKSELTSGLHFDVAQVNTIVYDNIEELPAKIVKRIKATIG